MMDSERRSTSVPREINGQDKATPEHVTVASVSLSALLKAKNSFYKSQNHLWTKFLLVPSHITLVPVPLPLVPGSTTFAQCCTRYHPSGTMVPLPCHPPPTSTSNFNLVFAKFANFVWVRPTTTMSIIIIYAIIQRFQNCLYDKHRCSWPYLDKVGKFGKH